MGEEMDTRACRFAQYMIETGATVRATARHFGTSKSTVHKYLTQRLEQVNMELYLLVRQVLSTNKAQRHIRGGQATRQKYLQQRQSEMNAGTEKKAQDNSGL